ncbi:hypothetical protein ACFO4N_17725 [Camelliibacillus cellulosilyticus]|uniref:Uncharacterized protein n=1 Tax=Camelliibacillus cellulosilyticus TaxID=2174486 RepID=A0ABV9GQM5_9BACL
MPGVGSVAKFSQSARAFDLGIGMGERELQSGLKAGLRDGETSVDELVDLAGKEATLRKLNAERAFQDGIGTESEAKALNKELAEAGEAETASSLETLKKQVRADLRELEVAKGIKDHSIIPKYEDVFDYEYNSIDNPDPLAKMKGQPIKNFYGGKYNTDILQTGTYFYRAGQKGGLTIPGLGKNALGQWFIEKPAISVIKVRIDTAVKPQWIDPKTGVLVGVSPINAIYKIKIPAGTKIYKGPVGYQGGVYAGGMDIDQIFIPEPWNISGVEVISEIPLK